MTKYRIISEPDPAALHRASRGTALQVDAVRLVTVVDAESLPDAVFLSDVVKPRHTDRRIVSVEEIHPAFSYADDEIGRALGTSVASPTGEQLVDPYRRV